MAIKCANCGQVLPKDNAKFCNSCGASLRPPPQHSQRGTAKEPLVDQSGGARELKGAPTELPLRAPTTRSGLYEQIAQQPPSRPAGASRSVPTVPPSWMRTLDRGARTGKPPQKEEAAQQVSPVPLTGLQPPGQGKDSNPSDKVLHSRVWETNEPGLPVPQTGLQSPGQVTPSFAEEDTIFTDESAVFPEDAVEDLPTAHMEANIPEPPIQKPAGTPGARELKGAPHNAPTVWDPHLDDVAQLSTSRLVSQRQVEPVAPLKQQGQPPMHAGGATFQKPPLTPQLRPRPLVQAAADQSALGGIHRSLQEGRQPGLVPQPKAPVSIVTKPVTRQGMSRKRLMIVLALFFVLVASGIATWIIAFKPFAVASITQPWQQFCDAGLRVSGQYPTGWMKQVDQNKGVHFSDGTDQFSIVSVAANGQDAATYLRKEASQLGITGLKIGTPVSFAGASWQQAQGSLLQSQTGVTYTETLLVTVHGNRFFTIMQIAPPGTYSDEDTTIFSGMRSSFQFSDSCP